MRIIDPMIEEFKHEAAITRKCFQHIPDGQWEWTPHERSMSMGRLASHIQEIPEWLSEITDKDTFVMPEDYKPSVASGKEELLRNWDGLVEQAVEKLNTVSDEKAMGTWTMQVGGNTVMEMPRVAVIRGILLNHLIHHRGQLSVYLRLAGGTVPSIYGPSADDDGGMGG
ncbi:MAG TPA: DinB family protein [Acidobacteriota bacterium]|nr:DinB family protein [Acidobacteriota bacterium]